MIPMVGKDTEMQDAGNDFNKMAKYNDCRTFRRQKVRVMA
jgi:hypothetical protein